jgi:hypothetical protein
MKTVRINFCLIAATLFGTATVFALSTPIGRDINFPKNYDLEKARAIRHVIQDERFHFVEGIVSHWSPDFGTRLSFEGNDGSLNEFFAALRRLPGIGLRVVLYHGRNDELRRDSDWQLDFSQARPNQLTVYVNLNARNMDLGKVKLPEWPAGPIVEESQTPEEK